MLYTSTENSKIKEIKKLYTKKYRDESNLFIVEGEHLVEEAHKNNMLEEALILEDYDYLYSNKNYVSLNVMKYISELDSVPKIIGICKKMNEKELGNKILVLDEIQDPGNLGTIIRSGVAFNVDTIVLSKNSVDVYNPKVIRATQGMIFNINIIIRDLESFIPELKNNGYKIYGTRVDNGKNIKNIEKIEKTCIIMGNEGKGVSKSILDMCDEYIYIDMNASCESLNVAVATSIILYELDK
jgi:TrmH family RNA methyltransferase